MTDFSSYRSRLGPVGVWLGPLAWLPIPEEQAAVRRIEELGYGSVWAGEALFGKEAFSHMASLLAGSERIAAGTGIANVWARHPASMEGGGATLGAAWPGRFLLGVGISHAPIVERSGQAYDKPMERMAKYLDDMDAAASSVRAADPPVPRMLAALRPRMLALATDHGDGALPYFVPVAHTPLAREALGADKLLIPEQAVYLTTDAGEGRRVAREHMAGYLKLANYVNNLRHLGYTDDDLADGGSDRLVDDIVAWGDEEVIAARVRAHLDGGADHVAVQPLGDRRGALTILERLAPVLLP
jgi:probable F420-dependent oxidoreductase